MKRLLLLFAVIALTTHGYAQLTPNGNSGSSITSYTSGATNDPIYIWCSDVLSTTQGSLTATPTSGVGPFTFNWFYHNQSNASWTSYTTQTGSSSTVTGLASDGYRVEIRDAGNAIVDCFIAWVWNLNTEVTASNSRTGCNQANLTSTVNTTGSFSYYNPPPPQSLIIASTQIQVCFTATHTYVSDLAFYLVGPASCGSPTILLSPNPGANGQGSVCNSGNNVSNLCFSNTTSADLDVCAASTPLTGTYGNYGATNTPIDWTSLIGCNAASGGWRVQIYDCIGADVGSLTNSTITFSNLASLCGSPTSISYNSGSINSAINDNSCTAGTASIFQVPPDPDLTTPITINATTTLQWSGPGASATTLNTTVPGVAPGSSDFIQTATTVYATANCTADDTTTFSYALPIVNAGADQTACSGGSVTLSGSGAVSYTWDNGVSNGVAFTPASTTTYTVIGTDAAGCTNTDQATINVGTNPTVDAGADQATCPGGSITLSGSGATSYSWNNGVANGVAFTPATTTTYTLTGTDAAGCQGTDQVIVTVHTLPPVNAGIDQGTCTGGPVTLSGSGATSYVWNNGVTNGVAFTPASTQTYTVTGTDANGCTNTDQATVTVHTLPTVNAGIDQAVCAGASVTLSGSGATSYVWNNGVTNGTAFTPATGTTTYTVTGTDANGCTNTDQAVVTVHALPTISAGADQSVCSGTAVTLTGTGGTSYVWNNGVTNGVAFTPAIGTVTYTVTGTDANSCTNTDQAVVTVHALPPVNAGIDQAVCPGGSVTLSGSGATSYVWNNGVTNGVAFTPASTQTYTVTGTDANGCTNTDQAVVTVNAVPTVNAGVDQSVCAGGSVTLSGSGAVSYIWNNTVTNGVPFTPGATQIYTVTGTNANGCQGTDQVTVTVNALPTIGAGADQNLCAGTATTLSGTGGVSYVWNNGVTNGTSFNPPLGSTTYTVTGTDANGCQGTDQVVLIVVPVPIADMNSAGPLSGYPGLSVTFSNASQYATTYGWDFDNGQTATSTDVNATEISTFNSPGVYVVVLTASNGICQDTDEMNVVVIPYEPLVIHVPNVFTPDGDGTNDAFYIDVENGVSIEVVIINRWGDHIIDLTNFTDKWDGTSKGNDVSEGTYFYKYTITGKDGTTEKGQGFVELIRK